MLEQTDPSSDPSADSSTASHATASFGGLAAGEGPALEFPGNFTLPVDHEGTQIFVRAWRPAKPEHTSPVLFIHDMTEDSTHYEEAAALLVHRGFCVYAMDLRGHGQSGRILGHVGRFAELVQDTLQIASWLRYQHGGRSPFLIAQGIGALVAIDFQRLHPRYCHGMILTAPTLVLHHPMPHWKRMLIRSLGEVSPTRRAPVALTPRLHHYDESARAAATRFVTTFVAVRRSRLSLGFVKVLLGAIDRLPSRINQITCRTLVLLPHSSDVIDIRKTVAMLQRVGSTKLEIVTLKHDRHNLLTESYSERITLLENIAHWLASHDQEEDQKRGQKVEQP